jgi:hypothetical protein
VARGSTLLLCVVLVGCSGAAPSIRDATDQQRQCVYVPRHEGASRARGEAAPSAHAGVQIVLVAATSGALPVAPLAPGSAPSLEGVSGEGLGDGVPRSVLRLVPEGSAGAEVEAGSAAGEVAVVGGAVVAAVGSGILVCLTASAAMDGEKTPIDIADRYYGTHFGDVKDWVQGRYRAKAPPGAAPKSKPDESDRKRLGRIYVTYTKLNKVTRRRYVGRTSMVVDLTQPRPFQEALAVLVREKNHHIEDESAEPKDAVFANAEVDVSDIGTAIDYRQRYSDVAYWRIRGREQQLIDSLGGARSDTGEPYQTENAVRGVAKDNPLSRRFHNAATELWGQLHPYTGY